MKTTLNLLAILLFPLMSLAQIKIGNLSIDKETAKMYLADCYLHPDTIKLRTEFDYGACYNCLIPSDTYEKYKRQAKDFNDALIKSSIGEIKDTIHYPARKDTLYTDGIIYGIDFSKMNKKRRIEKIDPVPSGSYITNTGKYLVPRHPSEIDFIKWKHSHKN